MHDFFEYHGIDILAWKVKKNLLVIEWSLLLLILEYGETLTKHIKKEPVSYIALFDNCVYDFPSYKPEPNV